MFIGMKKRQESYPEGRLPEGGGLSAWLFLQHAAAPGDQLFEKGARIVEVECFQSGNAVHHGENDKRGFSGREVLNGAVLLALKDCSFKGVKDEVVNGREILAKNRINLR
jgi:hypothetical protein